MIEIRVSCLKAMVVLKRDPYFQRLVALGQGNGNSIGLARDYRINYRVMHESHILCYRHASYTTVMMVFLNVST